MRKLIWGKAFVRAFKRISKKRPSLIKDIEDTLTLMIDNPFAAQLETHKLKGNLSGYWACSVSHDLRIVFEFVKSKSEEDAIFLIEIGTHDEVY